MPRRAEPLDGGAVDGGPLAARAPSARVEREGGLVEHDRLGGFLEVARALGDYDPAAGGKPAG